MTHMAPCDARQDENARAGRFGFAVDNTIGGTAQPNGWIDDWPAFYRERRLLPQLRLANDASLSRLGERLAANLERFFEGIEVLPYLAPQILGFHMNTTAAVV